MYDREAGHRLPSHPVLGAPMGREAGYRSPTQRCTSNLVNGLTPPLGATGQPDVEVETSSHNIIHCTHARDADDQRAESRRRSGVMSVAPGPRSRHDNRIRDPPSSMSMIIIRTPAASKSDRKDQAVRTPTQAATGTREFHPSQHGGRGRDQPMVQGRGDPTPEESPRRSGSV